MPPIIKKSVKRLDCTLWWTIFACFGVSSLDCNFKALIPTSVDGYSLTVLYQKWKKTVEGPNKHSLQLHKTGAPGGTVLNFKLV